MSGVHFCVAPSPAMAIGQAVEKWNAVAGEALAARGRLTAILSGGQTPGPLYRGLSQGMTAEAWDKMYIFLADERCVDSHDQASNRLMIEQTLLSTRAFKAGQLQLPSISAGDVPAAIAARYEAQIREFFGSNPAHFDIAVLGIGQDGHTASLFPGDQALAINDRWVAAVKYPGLAHERITLTRPLIHGATHIFFLAFGNDKAAVMKAFDAGDTDLPAREICAGHPSVWVFTDKEAMPYK